MKEREEEKLEEEERKEKFQFGEKNTTKSNDK